MGRAPCCSKVGLHRGPWTSREDTLLTRYIQTHGEGHWRALPKRAGLLRCGKSCRLRWMNYLRPDIKRGNIGPDEEDLIIRLHALLGNRWSLIAGRLPGRTDNEIKNYWNTHLSKRLKSKGIDPRTHTKISDSQILQTQEQQLQKKSKKNTRKKIENPQSGTKVHLPKASRVTSFPKNFQPFGFVDRGDREKQKFQSMVGNKSKGEEVKEDLELPPLVNDNFICGGEFENQSQNLAKDTMLEKLYEEYLELLEGEEEDQVELNSFAESLWALESE